MSQELEERRLLTVREAAARAGMPRDWFYELANTGRLPGCVRRGRRFYIVISVFDAALARGQLRRMKAAGVQHG